MKRFSSLSISREREPHQKKKPKKINLLDVPRREGRVVQISTAEVLRIFAEIISESKIQNGLSWIFNQWTHQVKRSKPSES